MTRRLPSCVPALFSAGIGLFILSSVPAQQPPAKADPPPASAPMPPDGSSSAGELRKPQEQNAKLFRELAQGLLRLAQKLERSDKPEDLERAKTIRAALKVAEESAVENQFQKLLAAMGKGASGTQDLSQMIGQDAELSKVLQEIVTILMTDDETARIRAEIARLTAFLKEVKDIKRREEIIRALTEAQKGDSTKIAKTQGDLAQQTKDLIDRMSGKKGGDGTGEPKSDPKAEMKGEGKPGEINAEPKDDTQDSKSTGKEGSGEPKAGAESKPGTEGSPKDGGSAKDGQEAKPEKAGPQARGMGEPKAGEPKAGEPNASEPKAGDPKADRQANAQADPKGKGEGKSESKKAPGNQPSAGRGIGGDPKNQQQQANSKGGGQQGQPGQPGQPNPNQQANQNQTPGRKQVQEAYPSQKGAEEDLNKQDRPNAAKKETKAIEDLAKAIEELEKRLKQLREEEMLKTLAALEARCSRMLAMQIEVYENTKAIHASVVKNNNVKTTADHQKSQQQASKEHEIVIEADRALKLLESEGSAVAFAKVLEEVKEDMKSVQKRLEATYVDTDTQGIEENIIAMLKDMIQALKKAQQDIQNQQNNNNNNNNNNKQNQRLIDLLAELRLIRALQVQVNTRTTMYGKKYSGEQTNDLIIQTELKQLSQRQVKLQDMIHKIATQANQ